MAANTTPIFTLKGDSSSNSGTTMSGVISSAANDFTGAGANNVLVFTSKATDGSYVRRLRFKAVGTNVATVARVFINNGSDPTTAANNHFFEDVVLPATTASATAQTGPAVDMVMEQMLDPGFRIYVGLATAVAAGYHVTPIAGAYS